MNAFHGALDASSATPAPAPAGGSGHGHPPGLAGLGQETNPVGETWQAMDTYFECITTCSLEDGECITRCVEELREHG
jgi:hypothetical protein